MVSDAPDRRVSPSAFVATMSDAPSRVGDVAARWTTLPGGLIDGGEIVVLAVKPSLWRPVFDSAAWLAASAVLAVVLITLGIPLPGLSVTATAQLVLLIGFTGLGLAVVKRIMEAHRGEVQIESRPGQGTKVSLLLPIEDD